MRYCLAGIVKNSSGEHIRDGFLVFDDSDNRFILFEDVGSIAEYFHESRKQRNDPDEMPKFSDPQLVIEGGGFTLETAPMDAADRVDLRADLTDYMYGII